MIFFLTWQSVSDLKVYMISMQAGLDYKLSQQWVLSFSGGIVSDKVN